MIRSTNIPIILNRICDDTNYILSALLVTADGELLGSSSRATSTSPSLPTPESLGTLVADIAWDYHRLGEECSLLHHNNSTESQSQPLPSKMECLFIEMDLGIVGISPCITTSSDTNNTGDNNIGCFVIVIATYDAPLGFIQMRLQSVTTHVQESLLLSSSSSSATSTTTAVLTTSTTTTNSNNNNAMTVT